MPKGDVSRIEGGQDKTNKSMSMIKSQAKRAYSAVIRASPVKKPRTTKKFQAYVELRRSQMEGTHVKEQALLREEIQRFINQNRLSQRVKYSPAIVSNA